MTTNSPASQPDFSRPQTLALGVGVAGLALSAVGWLASPEQFFRSYLLGYLFWVGLAIGCLPLLMIQHLTGGAWGLVIRRPLEAGARTLPLMLVLFVPLVLGAHSLYEWARPEMVAGSEVLRHKAPYLNTTFWAVRTAVYFAVWIALGHRLSGWSREQDRNGDLRLSRKMQMLSGPGIVFYFLAVTFAAVDWVMSLDPHWSSTIFGPLIAAGQLLNAFAFMIVLLALLSETPPISAVVRPDIFQDLGKLMLAFVMVWAYFAFSQYLIIWAGNLPEEIRWYLEHSRGGWMALGILIIVFHFFVPFFLLLSRDLKRSRRTLAMVAAGVVVVRFVEIFWTVTPLFHPADVTVHWLDLAVPAGIGGLWLWAFLGQLGSQPLLPLHDPYLREAFEHGGH
ncbi:MAG: hypothetical protein HYY35_06075 [Deltaproteobacteria bacterium]|nr:hypothetical protein [Deltaproteobacteria bacterium]